MVLLAWSADGAQAAQKKAPAKKKAARKKASPARKSGTASSKKGASTSKNGTSAASSRKPGTTTKSASSRGKKTPANRVTWRNRQLSPSPDRYREIQASLAAKGFLKPEDATGSWNQASTDALKKFQEEQNLESNGKINSLSLIALGLGPRRDPAPATSPKPPPQAPGPGQ